MLSWPFWKVTVTIQTVGISAQSNITPFNTREMRHPVSLVEISLSVLNAFFGFGLGIVVLKWQALDMYIQSNKSISFANLDFYYRVQNNINTNSKRFTLLGLDCLILAFHIALLQKVL